MAQRSILHQLLLVLAAAICAAAGSAPAPLVTCQNRVYIVDRSNSCVSDTPGSFSLPACAGLPDPGCITPIKEGTTVPGPVTLSSDSFSVNSRNQVIATVEYTDASGRKKTASCSAHIEIKAPDSDHDGTPDCADGCPDDAHKTEAGVCGCGASEADSDHDGTPNCVDGCPDDAHKTEAGVCGCGASEADSDHDGTPDCQDECRNDPTKIAAGQCGCHNSDRDSDNDGTADCNDRCPHDANKVQAGFCGCGKPDTDSDHDGIPDCEDKCPHDAGKVEPGICGCGSPDTDTDHDGVPDCKDACPTDAHKTSGKCGGTNEPDSDGDGIPDDRDTCDNSKCLTKSLRKLTWWKQSNDHGCEQCPSSASLHPSYFKVKAKCGKYTTATVTYDAPLLTGSCQKESIEWLSFVQGHECVKKHKVKAGKHVKFTAQCGSVVDVYAKDHTYPDGGNMSVFEKLCYWRVPYKCRSWGVQNTCLIGHFKVECDCH